MVILNYSVLNSQIFVTQNLYNTNSIVCIQILLSLNSTYSHSVLQIRSFKISSKMKTTKMNSKCNKMALGTVHILKKEGRKLFCSKIFWNFPLCS